ncbi:MAG: hypothetical protein RI885_706 [Actinomycetota bacterium]|jgi:hypothetical protein
MVRALAGTLIGLVILPSTAGCALIHRPEQRTIERVESQLELDQFGDVVCAFSNNPLLWEPQHPVRVLGVAGVDNVDEIVDRLAKLDFVEDADSVQTDRRTFLASDQTVQALTFEFDRSLAGSIPNFGSDDCLIPDDGTVGVYLTGFAK